MTLTERIKQRILKFLGLEKLSEKPNSSRYTFINSEETIRMQHLEECRIWYVGDSDEIANYYTNRDLGGNAKEPIYNSNKPNYFWGIIVAPKEKPIKKVHSGLPKAMIDTICNVIGMPDIDNEEYHDLIKEIINHNDFTHKLTQEARPLTLVEGWGGWKVNFETKISDYPIFQYYEGKDVEFVVKSGVLIGMIFKDYYVSNGKNYVFLETRRIDNGDSIIEYELYRYEKSSETIRVPLNTIEELAHLPEDGYIIKGLKKVLGVPCKYFYDVFSKDYGRSIFAGKIDIFDDIDQCLSQASQTDRVSTPVEYYPVDVLERNGGKTELPNVYNRQFLKSLSFPDGDGNLSGEIKTTQPVLNFEQYINRYYSLINVALTGVLSPATMGIDLSKRDNADAQREKEKITLMTRDNIMSAETMQLKELFNIALMIKEFIDTGAISLKNDYDISVKYCEFANPSFETMSRTLLPMWTSGAMSTEMYVNKLYGDNLSDEEKAKEIAKLEENRQADNLSIGDFGLEDDERTIDASSKPESEEQEPII